MNTRRLIKPLAAAVLLLASAGAAHAAITIHTTQASFSAAVGALGTDTYTGFSSTSSTPSPITRSAGSFGYTASVVSGGAFFGGGSPANPFLSTNVATDVMLLNSFTGGSVVAVGGNFFGSDISGLFAAGSVIVTASDASSSASQTISPTGIASGSFLGFVSDGPMLSLKVASVQPVGSFLWPSVDNLTLAAAVPEPGAYGLMLAGLGLVGWVARRRRA